MGKNEAIFKAFVAGMAIHPVFTQNSFMSISEMSVLIMNNE